MKRVDLIKYVTSIGVRDLHAAETIAHDVLADPKAKGYEIANARFKSLDYFKKVKRESALTVSLDAPTVELGEEVVSLYEVVPYDDRESVKQLEQRQLINELLDGADERTTLIVLTFLKLDKPNVKQVADELGLYNVQVQRALTRLGEMYTNRNRIA